MAGKGLKDMWPLDDDDPDDQALFNIRMGRRSLPFWADVLNLQMKRLSHLLAIVEDVRTGSDPAQLRPREWWVQLDADAHLVVIAVRHVLAHARHLGRFDAQAKAEYLEWCRGPYRQAVTARGIVEHFDRYWIEGKGDLKAGLRSQEVRAAAFMTPDGTDFEFALDDIKLPLLAMAAEALALAQRTDRLWNAMLERRAREALGFPST
jgi:hypothetical protein